MNVRRSIDHIVVAVADLDQAAARYERLGFTLTPRAAHPDSMGTSNRLMQLAGMNFIELLEVDRPDRLEKHQLSSRPRRFSFGEHNRTFVRTREGMSMLALSSADVRADLARLEAAGVETCVPLDLERSATLPDGSQVTVAFTLGFVTHPLMPDLAFFLCEHRFPEHFWKSTFQSHPNGAQSIAAVYVQADVPEAHVDFLTALSGGEAQQVDGGQLIQCGAQELLILNPQRMREIAPGSTHQPMAGPSFAGVAVETTSPSTKQRLVPAQESCGVFLAWRAVRS